MKVTNADATEDSLVTELSASVSIHRKDEKPIDAEETDLLVVALNDKVVEFLEECEEEGYCTAGSAGQVRLRTAEFHPDDRATDREEEVEVEEVQAVIHERTKEADEEEKKPVRPSKACTACHAKTTQLDANQCPMCGNPFQP